MSEREKRAKELGEMRTDNWMEFQRLLCKAEKRELGTVGHIGQLIGQQIEAILQMEFGEKPQDS